MYSQAYAFLPGRREKRLWECSPWRMPEGLKTDLVNSLVQEKVFPVNPLMDILDPDILTSPLCLQLWDRVQYSQDLISGNTITQSTFILTSKAKLLWQPKKSSGSPKISPLHIKTLLVSSHAIGSSGPKEPLSETQPI